MATDGSLQYYLPAQYSAASTPSVPVIGAGQQAQQQQSSGGGLPNLPSLNFGGNSTTGISGAINSLGFGGGAPVYGGVGPAAMPWMQPGMIANPTMAASGAPGIVSSTNALGGTASLTSSLGAAGIGAFAGNFLGRIGGNPTGGSIGGGAGAGIGMAIGGPVGAVIGGLAGGVLGGFFGGKKKPNPASLFAATTDGDKGITGDSYGSKHMDDSFARGTASSFSNYVKTLKSEYGIDIGGQTIFGGSDKGRNFIRTQDTSLPYDDPYGYATDTIMDFDPNDPNSVQKAYNGLAVDILKRKKMYTPELEKQINEIGTVEGAKKTIAAQNKAMGRSAEGVPMIGAVKDSKALSFSDYTKQHNQGRWA